MQDQLVVKLEAENVLPYDSQLFFFNGVGLLLSATKDKRLQQDTLKVRVSRRPYRHGMHANACWYPRAQRLTTSTRLLWQSVVGKFLEQVEEILGKELYKQDTPERPVCANYLQQVVAVVTALSSGTLRSPRVVRVSSWRTNVGGLACTGFGSLEGQSGMEELLAMWSQTSHVALRIVAAIPQYPDLRLKVSLWTIGPLPSLRGLTVRSVRVY
jgi:hypothetical protein